MKNGKMCTKSGASITRRKLLQTGAVATAFSLASPWIAKAATIELKITHFLPPRHGFHADFLAPWAAELEKLTDGDVKTEIFPGPSRFGKLTRQADQVRAGVTDIGLGLRSIPRGRFSSTSIIEMPFLLEKPETAARVLWDLFEEGSLGNEFDEFKVISLFSTSAHLIHTISKPVKKLEDLRGLRMRTASPAISAMLEHVGASPVGLPPSAIYENLQKGVIDGLVTTWDLVGAIKLNELVKYHTDARAAVTSFYTVMNKEKYESLPNDIRAVIDSTTGPNLVPKFGPWWNKWDAFGEADATKRGNEIVPFDAALRTEWRNQLNPMIEQQLTRLEGDGVSNPAELYARAQELVGKYET